VRTTKCDSCRESLIDPEAAMEPMMVHEALMLDYSASTFLEQINRGGLAQPAEYTFLLSVQCWMAYEDMRTNAELNSKFLSAACHRKLFVKVIDRLTSQQLFDFEIGDNCCTKGHDLKELLVNRFFNCVAKNLVKELTVKANKHSSQNVEL
jgi:hypothetical protein